MREGWEYKKFEDCICKVSKTKQVQTSAYNDGTKYPIISQEDKLISGYCDDESMLFQIGNPVVIFGDHTRVLKYIDFNFVVGADGVKILMPKDFIEARFLFYYLNWYNVPNLGYSRHYKLLKEIQVPIPHLSLQHSIAVELDKINSLIKLKREQLRDLDNMAQSLFYEMFGDPVENEKGWDVKKLGDVCNIVRGGSPRPIEQFLGGVIPWIKIGDATKGNDIYIDSTKEHIIEQGLSKTRMIPKGSLIFANCGVSLGFARIINFDGCIHDGWLAFQNVDQNKLTTVFLLKSLNMCTEYFRGLAPEGTQPNLNTNIMKRFVQILPPLPLQQQFADRIELIEKQKAEVNTMIKDLEQLLASRMQYWFE